MKKKNNLLKKTKFLAIPFALILVVVLFFLAPKVLKVNNISCNNQYGPCSSYLTEKLDKFHGSSYGDAKKEIRKILENEIAVSDYSQHYRIPNILVVDIIEKKPSYSILGTDKGVYASVDSEGVILRLEDTTNLPYIKVEEKVGNLGDKVTENNLFALRIMEKVFSAYSVKTGVIKDDTLFVELTTPVSVIFPLSGDPDLLMASLDLIIRRLKAEGELSKIEIDTIDLRYKNPVLR